MRPSLSATARAARWLNRHLGDDIERILCRVARAPVRIALALGFSGLLIGGTLYSMIEKGDWIDGVYWALVVMTTVGFGDFSPETIPGRWVFVYVVASGILSTVLMTSALAGAVAQRRIQHFAGTAELDDDFDYLINHLERLKATTSDPRVKEALAAVARDPERRAL